MAPRPRNAPVHPYRLLPNLTIMLGGSIAALCSRRRLPLDWEFPTHQQHAESMAAVVEYFESGNLAPDRVPGLHEFGTVVRSGVFSVTRCVVKGSFVEGSFVDQAPELRLAGDPVAAA
jgi:hypothetical protein